ncbi:DMP19 family protein [Arthrobacter sp. TWP1-1]|uniref:DMP19 family protein n=1 Tax=Arthrobacter sp. TWP1-1 TaxID=2804568 RepID=UPI003CF8929E
MTTNQFPVVLTTEDAASDNEDVVGGNVSVVNEMYLALLNANEIAPNALRSYFVDFYLAQALDGGFAQYVFMTPDREELDAYIREGFEAMGAKAHLELFNRTAALYDLLSEQDTEAYLEDESDSESERSEGVIAMEELDNEFEELFESEDVTGLNAQWLRGQEGLLILDAEELAAHIATRVATVTDLEARRAEAELEDAPEFEQVIRELCSVAGHELEKITLGDPNYEHNGEKVLAWHFTTDKGEYIMIDDDIEAVMIEPKTKEIIATVEFELDDELADA